MHFHLPKPLHGWREFAGEVGVIVLGVLIALSAEQIVQYLHSRWELRELRSALNREVQYNLGAYDYRLKQSSCAQKRLGELEEWERQWRTTKGVKLASPIAGPDHLALLTSVWRAQNATITDAMPLNEHLAYSTLYDWLAKFNDIVAAENTTWIDLQEFEAATKLDETQLMRLHGLIARARTLNDVIGSNWVDLTNVARPMGLKPINDPRVVSSDPNDVCRPILPVGMSRYSFQG